MQIHNHDDSELSGEIDETDAHPGDLTLLLERFPYCDVHELIVAVLGHTDELPNEIDDLVAKLQVGFLIAIQLEDLEALAEAIALTAALFWKDWKKKDQFLQVFCPLLLEVLQWNRCDLEIWHDCLNVVCYALSVLEFSDPSLIRCAIETQLFILMRAEVAYDDRERALEFLLLMVNADEECVNDEEVYMLYERLEELCSTETEI
jgi:hypothetical protein